MGIEFIYPHNVIFHHDKMGYILQDYLFTDIYNKYW